MNPTEQKNHKTALQGLEATVIDIAESAKSRMDTIDESITQVALRASNDVGEERTVRLKLAEEQRSYVDYEDRMLRHSIQELQRQPVLVTSTFWERLRWLVAGR